jgi:hypothetical protein
MARFIPTPLLILPIPTPLLLLAPLVLFIVADAKGARPGAAVAKKLPGVDVDAIVVVGDVTNDDADGPRDIIIRRSLALKPLPPVLVLLGEISERAATGSAAIVPLCGAAARADDVVRDIGGDIDGDDVVDDEIVDVVPLPVAAFFLVVFQYVVTYKKRRIIKRSCNKFSYFIPYWLLIR